MLAVHFFQALFWVALVSGRVAGTGKAGKLFRKMA
jgi:hypothetical protein